MTEPLRVKQRVQLNMEQMTPARREIYAGDGPGKILNYTDEEHVWVEFDNGWKAHFHINEVQPEIAQLSLF